LHTTGQRLQRGRDLQHRFFGFTTRFFATLRAYEARLTGPGAVP
jgi:hypothetical protein